MPVLDSTKKEDPFGASNTQKNDTIAVKTLNFQSPKLH